MLPLEDSGPTGALLVESPELARVMTTYFELVWRASREIHGRTRTLGAPDRLVLELLLDGLQDEAIARRTGVSVKTVRRRITALMAVVGATTPLPARRRGAPPARGRLSA